ncbi:MAG: phage antirepressor N-terminal domain-containing protein [Methylobacter sp.]
MSAPALTVNFHGTNLLIVEHNGQPYTPMKPIVVGMGLGWSGQFEKLKSNTQRWGVRNIRIPTKGDMQEVLCMPLRKLAGWLSTISPNKVKPELRETVIQYQNECDDALWDYWHKKHEQNQYGLKQLPEQKTKTALPGGLTLEMQDEIKALIKSRVETELPREKWRSGSMKCWGSIKSKFGLTKGQTYKDLPPEHYASCISLLARLPLEGELMPNDDQAKLTHEVDFLQREHIRLSKELDQCLTVDLSAHEGLERISLRFKSTGYSSGRWIVKLSDGEFVIKAIKQGEFLTTSEELADRISDSMGLAVKSQHLLSIAKAAVERMQRCQSQ